MMGWKHDWMSACGCGFGGNGTRGGGAIAAVDRRLTEIAIICSYREVISNHGSGIRWHQS